MRRIVSWLAATVTIVVLLFSYHTSTDSSATAAGPSAIAPPTGSSTAPSSGSTSSDTGATAKTYTGSVAETRWGPVQVRITVAAGKISQVDVLEYPQGNHRDVEINDYAIPALVQETLDAQSAQVDMVSGATVTSTGYLQSLQSALDQAGR